MRADTIARAVTFAMLVAGTSILAAPEQTKQPGQMTEAHVWVQNRGRSEAVPVELRDVKLDGPVEVREVRRLWDYEMIAVAPAQNLAAALNARGAAGWETTGIAFVDADGTTRLLLKRSR
jgi:hypothetical protein